MDIQDALKETGKAYRQGMGRERYADLIEDRIYWHFIKELRDNTIVNLRSILCTDWLPYYEVEQIVPKEVGELWKGDSGEVYVTVFRKGILCFHDLKKRDSVGYLDFKRNDSSAWGCSNEPIHNQNGWTRIYPEVPKDK